MRIDSDQPIISVIIPSFRSGRYIRHAVDSVLGQAGPFDVAEVLVIDDASDDEETIRAYSDLAMQPKVRVIQNRGLKGSAGARNTGIGEAKGNWIVFLDADDLLLPQSIERRVALLAKHPDLRWCGGDFVKFRDADARRAPPYFLSRIDSYPFLQDAYGAGESVVLRQPLKEFLAQAPASTGVIMAARSALLEVGCFDETLRMQQDIHLFLRMAARFDYGFVGTPVMAYREHDSNTTKDDVETQQWRIRAYEKLLTDPAFSGASGTLESAILRLTLGNLYAYRARGDFAKALRLGWAATRRNPTSPQAWKAMLGSLLLRT